MEFVHTEIEQQTKVTVQLELDATDVTILLAIFAADLRLPKILEEDGDLKSYEITRSDVEQLMGKVYRELEALDDCL